MTVGNVHEKFLLNVLSRYIAADARSMSTKEIRIHVQETLCSKCGEDDETADTSYVNVRCYRANAQAPLVFFGILKRNWRRKSGPRLYKKATIIAPNYITANSHLLRLMKQKSFYGPGTDEEKEAEGWFRMNARRQRLVLPEY
ncbi:hypothetical protein J6590_046826 [Homalodisca vitripennis]|nr:hypothetical protein J6590_046826 [Homalodisca vitripennis]